MSEDLVTALELKYPHDRIDGCVLLTLGNAPFVPRFTRCEHEANSFLNLQRYWRNWRILMKRYYGNDFEPNSRTNARKTIN